MLEIDDKVMFVLKADQLEFTTQTNGDRLVISGIGLTKEEAASLAYLVNYQQGLEVKIRIKPD